MTIGVPSEGKTSNIELDITRSARVVRTLRVIEYAVLTSCAATAINSIEITVRLLCAREWNEAGKALILTAGASSIGYLSTRHVATLDPFVWRSYLWIYPLLLALGVFSGTLLSGLDQNFDGTFPSVVTLAEAVLFTVVMTATSIIGLVCVSWLLLSNAPTSADGSSLARILTSLRSPAAIPAPVNTRTLKSIRRPALLWLVIGALVYLTPKLAQSATGKANAGIALALPTYLVACACWVHARRHLQLGAEQVLSIDKRAPVLFLRSFVDEDAERYRDPRTALLDFSLDARLAKHFQVFGPFIGVGAPRERLPVPGAARVRLSDEEWRARVELWIQAARWIVMYCGTTDWVNWELRQVLAHRRLSSLILILLQPKSRDRDIQYKDTLLRAAKLRDVMQNTSWSHALASRQDFSNVRALLFEPSGALVLIKSLSATRDAYHLATLLAHHHLLRSTGAFVTGAEPRRSPPPVLNEKTACKAALLLCGIGLMTLSTVELQPGDGEPFNLHEGTSKLVVKRSAVYYQPPITKHQAVATAAELTRQQYFTDDYAATVHLQRIGDVYRLGIVADPTLTADTRAMNLLGWIGAGVSTAALNGAAVEVAVCDPNFGPLHVLPRTRELRLRDVQLYYTHPIAERDAKAIVEELVLTEHFDQPHGTMDIRMEDGSLLFRFGIDRSRVADVHYLAELAGSVTRNMFVDHPLFIELCDTLFGECDRHSVTRPLSLSLERSMQPTHQPEQDSDSSRVQGGE